MTACIGVIQSMYPHLSILLSIYLSADGVDLSLNLGLHALQ